jgi:hypothetical protein
MIRESSGTPDQGHESPLRHVFSHVRIANHAQRRGINQVNMPPHQFGEGRFGPALRIIPQQLLIGQTVHSLNSNRQTQNRTRKVKIRFDGVYFHRDLGQKRFDREPYEMTPYGADLNWFCAINFWTAACCSGDLTKSRRSETWNPVQSPP